MAQGFENNHHSVEQEVHKPSFHGIEPSKLGPITPSDHNMLMQTRAHGGGVPEQFGTPNIFDTEKNLHPDGAFSPEGPAAKNFDGLGANGHRVENGVLYATSVDAEGAQHRIIRDGDKNTKVEDVLKSDGTTQSIKSENDFREEKTFNIDGTLKTDKVDDERKIPGADKQDFHSVKEYDHDKLIGDSSHWKSPDGQWHEHIYMKDSEGNQWQDNTDGKTTVKRMTKPDGSWTQSVQTRDVEVTDPATGRKYKTMTVEDTKSTDPPSAPQMTMPSSN